KMRPEMLQNWWTKEIADALQQFYDDLVGGARPRLAIGAPPQHGKSLAAEDFIAWVSGRNPELKTIFASYSADLGVRTNLALLAVVERNRQRVRYATLPVFGCLPIVLPARRRFGPSRLRRRFRVAMCGSMPARGMVTSSCGCATSPRRLSRKPSRKAFPV